MLEDVAGLSAGSAAKDQLCLEQLRQGFAKLALVLRRAERGGGPAPRLRGVVSSPPQNIGRGGVDVRAVTLQNDAEVTVFRTTVHGNVSCLETCLIIKERFVHST